MVRASGVVRRGADNPPSVNAIDLQRANLGSRLRDDLVCDTCGVPATMVHLLPWCEGTEEVALTGECDCRREDEPEEVEEEETAVLEPRHLPSGYFFFIHKWRWDFTSDPGKWSMRDQVRTKRAGDSAISKVDERLSS